MHNIAAKIPHAFEGLTIGEGVRISKEKLWAFMKGKVVSVYLSRRRPLFHIVYGDNGEEDFDYEELQFVVGLYSCPANDLHLEDDKNVTGHKQVKRTRREPTCGLWGL